MFLFFVFLLKAVQQLGPSEAQQPLRGPTGPPEAQASALASPCSQWQLLNTPEPLPKLWTKWKQGFCSQKKKGNIKDLKAQQLHVWLSALSNLWDGNKSGTQRLGLSRRDLGVKEDVKLTGRHTHIDPSLWKM